MLVESVAAYYRRRAAEERAFATGLADETLRRSHFVAAERYERQALAAPSYTVATAEEFVS